MIVSGSSLSVNIPDEFSVVCSLPNLLAIRGKTMVAMVEYLDEILWEAFMREFSYSVPSTPMGLSEVANRAIETPYVGYERLVQDYATVEKGYVCQWEILADFGDFRTMLTIKGPGLAEEFREQWSGIAWSLRRL
jgi:hypothetical protein